MSLVFDTLGEEKKTFASLTSMSNIRMSNVLLLTTEVAGKMLGLDRVVSEPEEFLGKAQAPKMTGMG